MIVLPVIHHLHATLSLEQAEIAAKAGADGVFLISHQGADEELPGVGKDIKASHGNMLVGASLLQTDALKACALLQAAGLDTLWADNCYVDSSGATAQAAQLHELSHTGRSIQIFAGVAFKYQKPEPNPALAAYNTLQAGFLPTTSGAATGSAPQLEKITAMSEQVQGRLAVASGLSVDNIALFAPYISHALVASSVSSDEHHFDYDTLARFVDLAKRQQAGQVPHRR